MIDFPEWVKVTPCERRSRSFIGHTDNHGARKIIATGPIDTPPGALFGHDAQEADYR